jgi:pantoate--beta-alanine ligase
VSLTVVRSVGDVRDHLAPVRRDNKRIGLVPTMGALHTGHAGLIERARAGSDYVVVSIFVNPLQFGPGEDYLMYPRPIEKDLEVCRRMGANLIFAPEVKDIYISDQRAFVEVERLGDHLCGPFRPGHFRGVATVVAKIFNVVQPDEAYFGEKDYQQLCIVRRMVQDLNLGIEIRPIPTYRDEDGLALSSRNAYLQPAERAAAPALFRALTAARRKIEQGERKASAVKEAANSVLAAESLVRVQYLEVVDPVEVQPVEDIKSEVRIAAAIWMGKTRLIDNVAAVPPISR